jgi:pilus assembly protein CpaE
MELAALSGRRCGLVDLNLEFGDICCAFDCRPRFTISDACADPEKLDRSVLKSVLHDLPSNVSILARPNDIEESDTVTPDALELIFKLLDDMYPNVVVDLPRATSFLSAVALAKADRVLIVGQLSVPIIRNATRVYECVMQMGADEDCVEIVLNRYNANYERITIEDVEKHFARPVFATIPNDYKNVAAAVDMGHPIGADSPASPARKAIHDMARKILGDQAVAESGDGGGDGFFSKLWKRPSEKPGADR